jgi:hypothetical protein
MDSVRVFGARLLNVDGRKLALAPWDQRAKLLVTRFSLPHAFSWLFAEDLIVQVFEYSIR